MRTGGEPRPTRAAACLLLLALTVAIVAVSWYTKMMSIRTALPPLENIPSDNEMSIHITYTGSDDDVRDAILASVKKYDIDRGFIDFCAENKAISPGGDFFASCRRYLSSGGYRDEMWETLTGYTFSVLYDIYTGRIEDESVTVLGDLYTTHKTTLAFTGTVDATHDHTVSHGILSMTNGADILFADIRTPISSSGELLLCETLGVDIVSVTDANADSLDDTLRVLSDAGISSLGPVTGIRYYISGGIKLALCSFPASSGIDTVSLAESNADVVIAIVRVDPDARADEADGADGAALFHDLVDAGADIVIGMCRGALLPVEYYNGKPILCGLNPLFESTDTAIITVSASVGIRPVVRFYPCTQSDGEVALADGTDAARIIGMMNSQSSSADIGDDNRVRER